MRIDVQARAQAAICGLALVVGCATAAPTSAPAATAIAKDAKVAAVENMIDAWNTRNWSRVTELFTEDGVLHSVMMEPIVGRKAIGQRIAGLGAGVDSIKLEVRNIGRVGDVVFVERVDRFVYKGHPGKVPVVGVLEIEGDKVKVWREYYDRAELLREMGLTPSTKKSE